MSFSTSICQCKEQIYSAISDASIQVFTAIHELPFDWEIVTQSAPLFLQKSYLRTLEEASPKGYNFFYVLFYQEDRAVGVSIAQAFYFDGAKQFNLPTQQQTWWKKWIAQQLKAHFLVIGNATLTGEFGIHFLPFVTASERADFLHSAIQLLENQYVPQTDITVIKDFYDTTDVLDTQLKKAQFHRIAIQPNMVLSLPEHWRTFDDYLGDLRSKYRVRAKRAKKKSRSLTTQNFDVSAIEQYESRLHELYESIADTALMNVAYLPKNYFSTLKKELGDCFQLTAYFDQDQLIGFHTLIRDHRHLEAHFLGLEEAYNASHQLYLNMLFNLVNNAIEQRSTSLSFSRTALEIKSSVGAVAQPIYGYVKHRFGLFNLMVPFLFDAFKAEEWLARHPFRAEEEM